MYGQPPRMVYTSSQASSIPTSSGSNGSSRQPSVSRWFLCTHLPGTHLDLIVPPLAIHPPHTYIASSSLSCIVYLQRIPGDVPTAVRNLLLSTKQLQEVLQQWSVGGASESQVSNVYVKTGTDFNAAMHAFAHHKIDLR